MSRINNFKGFSKVYENETNVSSEELINIARKEMPLEDVADDAAELMDPNKSDISDKMIQAAQAQSETQNLPEERIRENYTGKDLINPAAMDSIMKSAIARLPILTAGSIKFRGNMVDIPVGAEYVAQSFKEYSIGYYGVTYKDRTGKYKEAYIDYKPTAEEIEHVKHIFEDLAKKSKWLNFVDKTVTVAGPTLLLLGFGLAMFGMMRFQVETPDKWLSTGGGGYSHGSFSWDTVAPIGGYEVATGGSLIALGAIGLGSTSYTSEKAKAIDNCISRLTSVLKAYLEPLNMSITDLINASDLHAVLNTNMAEVSGNVTQTKSTVESVSSKKVRNFKKFK